MTQKQQIVISLDDDIYWKLVKLGAELQTPIDEYIEMLLITHVVENE